MADTNELKKIKKEYGENFMHLCRELFPSLLEHEGVLSQILSSTFSKNCRKFLYKDITHESMEEIFKTYVYSKVDVEQPEIKIIEDKTPYELLDEAGYELFECTTEEEIQSFKKYYEPGEELCTFIGGRLRRCEVFFAVKKNAEEIKREDFKKPRREDEYGTSVMGIQFTKHGLCTVSIKNRYNHTVNNPDATYGNDLDKIAPGLTQSFAKLLAERGLELDNSNIEEFELPKYTVANDGKYYKYNMEINQVYYCPGNVIIDHGNPVEIGNPESQVLMDYFIVDTKAKKVSLYDETIKDSFIDEFQDLDKIEIQKLEEGVRKIELYKKGEEKPIAVEIDKDNQIIIYENENIEEIGNNFLLHNSELLYVSLPNLRKVGHRFLFDNQCMNEIVLPKLAYTGDSFMYHNNSLDYVELPNLTNVGSVFLINNYDLIKLELPNLVKAGDSFLEENTNINSISLPKLEEVGHNFLHRNEELTQLSLPELTVVGDSFLLANEILTDVSLPKLSKTGDSFLFSNKSLTQLSLPNLTKLEDMFMDKNKILTELDVPKISRLSYYALSSNPNLRKQLLPIVKKRQEEEERIMMEYFDSLIDSKEIATLDKNAELTTTEINIAKEVLENTKEKEAKHNIFEK